MPLPHWKGPSLYWRWKKGTGKKPTCHLRGTRELWGRGGLLFYHCLCWGEVTDLLVARRSKIDTIMHLAQLEEPRPSAPLMPANHGQQVCSSLAPPSPNHWHPLWVDWNGPCREGSQICHEKIPSHCGLSQLISGCHAFVKSNTPEHCLRTGASIYLGEISKELLTKQGTPFMSK